MHHPADGFGDHRRRVIRVHRFNPGREEWFQTVHRGANRLGSIKGVGACGQADGDTRGRLAIGLGVDAVVFAAQTDISHITQAHLGAVAIDLKQNVTKLLGGLQSRLADDSCGKHRTFARRKTTNRARSHLYVLRLNRLGHVDWSQLELVQFGRVQPDSHCVLRAPNLKVTDA
ncbi:hypothetical protein D3C85_1280210 [compost metagenome]